MYLYEIEILFAYVVHRVKAASTYM
jgi:hypothetical protein